MGSNHLISDDETRKIAEGFLADSVWLGDVTWAENVVIGPNAAHHAGFDGQFPKDAQLAEGQKWSWTVRFTDPAGVEKSLSHEVVLAGLTRIVYGDHDSPDGWSHMGIRQWFTEPASERKRLTLSAADHSRICQKALYDKIVYEPRMEGFPKSDWFEDQRGCLGGDPKNTP
ncbi:hypothetical protein BX286_6229 [Streptomyces sp. 3211.6]|uniref:hypothetical protein n=1 Tax=Streptomyces sp. 3211.6 TaxID=1938845 RepID=UPI000EB26878|nr:hypothetical protein [Streptomyces sp. 3211.6]RKT08147.1 hypothetical protein BX286_6229 [Streptomyces sp. 3211.6]